MTDKKRTMLNSLIDHMSGLEDEAALKIINDYYDPLLLACVKKTIDRYWLMGSVTNKQKISIEIINEVKKELG
jgi:hypothetical protein